MIHAKQWLTTKEAGELLGLSGATIRNMCNDGRLPFIRPSGNQRRILRAEIEAYLAKLGHTPQPEPTPLVASPQIVLRKPSSVLGRIQKKARKQLSQQPS